MKAGNANYLSRADFPEVLGLFPLETALVLPGGYLSLNVYEKRYLELINDALKGAHVIGIIQIKAVAEGAKKAQLYDTGCIARIISYTETGDNRLIISLQGICRFKLDNEVASDTLYRRFYVTPWLEDLNDEQSLNEAERIALMEAFVDFFDANDLETDWERAMETPARALVNALAISAPFNTAEKQALLEATTIHQRAETLIALAERSVMAQGGVKANDLQ